MENQGRIKKVGIAALASSLSLLLATPIFVAAALHVSTTPQAVDVAAPSADFIAELAAIEPAAAPDVPGVARLAVNLTGLVADIASNLPQDFNAEDQCLAQAVYFEARSETLEGQLAVAQVVLNRVVDARFPSSICKVVFQGETKRHRCQFSFACDGQPDRPRNAQAWSIARAISHIALNNYWHDVTSVSTHYHADYVAPYWGDLLEQQVQVGRHIFYRDNSF
ncbi:MAG: cell wall hydrolase [Pseudomonadota bacterium]